MKQTEAIIERVRRIERVRHTDTDSKFLHLEIAVDDEYFTTIKPGQSLLARLNPDSWHPYLNEHWWPVNINKNIITVERRFENGEPRPRYEPGQFVTLYGLVGKPYGFRKPLRNVLLMAYNTAPTPLILATKALLSNKISVTLALLGTARDYPVHTLSPEVEVVMGFDGDNPLAWSDQVMTLGWADQVFVAVGNDREAAYFREVLTLFEEKRSAVSPGYLFGVFQPILPCGEGACHACTIAIQKGNRLACVEGPWFDLTQVILP